MSLFLFEATFSDVNRSKEIIKEKVNAIQKKLEQNKATLIEIQISTDLSHLFFIIETEKEAEVKQLIEAENIAVVLSKEVRLIGEDIDRVKQQQDAVNYLVEWNLPENLTMDEYLKRKEKNSVRYSEVPEVSFARTYVCEDMTKCLCFYDAPNKEMVEKARKVVSAPIDSMTELGDDI